jgi:hypothetical protein
VQLEHASSLAALERGRIMAEAKERHVDDVACDVELAGAAVFELHVGMPLQCLIAQVVTLLAVSVLKQNATAAAW